MRSLINNFNSSKSPFVFIVLFIFIYICPNIKFLSVGENSFFPIFIFLFGFSFFNEKELYVYIIIAISCLIFPLYSTFFDSTFSDSALTSSLMSLYIITVPVITSISLGRIIGSRFSYLSDQKILKELKLIFLFLITLFLFSALGKLYFSTIFTSILHAGRSSHQRLAFFFTEPSQGSSVILAIYTIVYFVLNKNDFSKKLGTYKKYYGIILLFFSFLITYLAQPLTLIAQLILVGLIYASLIAIHFILNLFFKNKISLYLLGLKKSYIEFVKILLGLTLISSITYYLATNVFERLIGLFSFIGREGFFLGISLSAGNRFYYAFTSIVHSILNPLSIPGDWVGQFKDSLNTILNQYSLMPPDYYGLLQLYKNNPLLIKPSGWLYFTLYDLGIIGFFVATFFIFFKYNLNI